VALHYCFQAKENLLWAVFEHLAELVRNDIAQVSAPDQSTSMLAAHLVEETVGWAIANPAANRAQIEIWLWAERNDSELAVRLYDMVIEAWKGLLRRARPPLAEDELESLTRVFLAIIDGLRMQLITHGDELAVLRETQTAREMLTAYVGRS
jgi:AcrR family transcriptional regulator